MRRLRVLAVLLVGWIAAGQVAPVRDQPAIFGEVGRILTELSEISGLPARQRVVPELINREQVRDFLTKRLKEAVEPGQIRAEELTLKAFGLVPPDFDLARSTVNVLTEQAAAFYDFRKKKLFVTDSAPQEAFEAALVHELAHALADQSFRLERFLKRGESDDGALARMAVMEGQATWLMAEYLARVAGRSLKDSPEVVEALSRLAESPSGHYPELSEAPLYIRATLLFPYSEGLRFQHAAFARHGKSGFAEVFRRAPVSTQQVLHPEKYFAGIQPTSPAPPQLKARGYRAVASGSFGQLDHAILLEQYAGREAALQVAPHWRGGQYRVYEKRGRPEVALAYASEWATPEAARRFFQLYRRVLEGKWKRVEVAGETADSLAGKGDSGYFRIERRGVLFTSLEGAEAPPGPAVH